MASATWQLIINYLPIIGTTISTFLLIAGLLVKNDKLKLIAIVLILVMSTLGFIVFETSEKTERILESDITINHAAVLAHEYASKPAFLAHTIAGLFSLIALILYKKKKKVFNIIGTAIVAFTLFSAGLMSYAGYLGDRITHAGVNIESTESVIYSSSK